MCLLESAKLLHVLYALTFKFTRRWKRAKPAVAGRVECRVRHRQRATAQEFRKDLAVCHSTLLEVRRVPKRLLRRRIDGRRFSNCHRIQAAQREPRNTVDPEGDWERVSRKQNRSLNGSPTLSSTMKCSQCHAASEIFRLGRLWRHWIGNRSVCGRGSNDTGRA